MRHMYFFLLLVAANGVIQAQPVGYSYGKTITIQVSQVSGTSNHTNFPVLISLVDNDLRTTANGGHVTDANGYDIVFYTSDCLTKLDHQIESYTASSGTLVAWVRIPTLSVSVNTIIHMYYGKSSASTDPSVMTTWNSAYKSVWHFNNSLSDFTANGNTLTDNSTSNFASAKIAAGRDLNNSTNVLSSGAGQYLRVPNGFLASVTNFTFEGWVLLDRSDSNWERILDFGQGTNINFFLTPSSGTGSPAETRARITTGGSAAEQGVIVANTTNTGSWIHWAVTIDNSTGTMAVYRNGSLLGSTTGVTLKPSNMESSTANYLGRSQYTTADHYIDAKFDEFRISTTARSAGWITTSYNNQNTPSSFYTVSSESVASTLCSILPVRLLYFKATPDGAVVNLDWATSTETNNDYFTIERSEDGSAWHAFKTVGGAGTTEKEHTYSIVDQNPYSRTYYRLRQTDYDGQETTSHVTVAYINKSGSVNIYTNPEKKQLIIDDVSDINSVMIFSSTGKNIRLPGTLESGTAIYSTAGLSPGIYVVHVANTENKTISRKIYIP